MLNGGSYPGTVKIREGSLPIHIIVHNIMHNNAPQLYLNGGGGYELPVHGEVSGVLAGGHQGLQPEGRHGDHLHTGGVHVRATGDIETKVKQSFVITEKALVVDTPLL